MRSGARLSHHILLICAISSLMFSSVMLASSPQMAGMSHSWIHTTRQDFANGTGWNVDVDSDPGNVTLESSAETFIRSEFNPGLRQGPIGSWDDSGLVNPIVLKENGKFKMWYAGDDTGTGSYRIGLATSSDGVNWTKPNVGLVNYGGSVTNNIVLDIGAPGSSEDAAIIPGTVIHDASGYRMWYSCKGVDWSLCFATSSDGIAWGRHPSNPVSTQGASDILSPVVVTIPGGFTMTYSSVTVNGLHRLGWAWSPDGVAWTHSSPLPAPPEGVPGTWNGTGIMPGTVIKSSGEWRLWFSGLQGSVQSIGYATSMDGKSWVNSRLNPILWSGSPGSWDSASLSRPWVIGDGLRYWMWYAGFDGLRWSIGLARSAFGERIAPPKTNPVLEVGDLDSWDSGGVLRPSVVVKDGIFHMWFTGTRDLNGSSEFAIGYASSVDEGVTWVKHMSNPILEKSATGWDSSWVGFSWVIWDNVSGSFKMWYTGSDGSEIRIGLANSTDGVNWQRDVSNPVEIIGNAGFNVSDVRCPWVDRFSTTHLQMIMGNMNNSKVATYKAFSDDEGLTWLVYGSDPLLSPVDGTWESGSVSCPVQFAANPDNQEQWLWYEGSSDILMPAFGRIGLAKSTDYGQTYTRMTPEGSLAGNRMWNSGGVGGPAFTVSGRRVFFHGFDGRRSNIGVAFQSNEVDLLDVFVEPVIHFSGTSSNFIADMSSPVILQENFVSPTPWTRWTQYIARKENGTLSILSGESFDGKDWGTVSNVQIDGLSPGDWDIGGRKPLSVLKVAGVIHLWYIGLDSTGSWSIGHATSPTPNAFVADSANPVLTPCGPAWWDCEGIGGASVVYDAQTGRFEMWYSGLYGSVWRIGYAYSTDGSSWKKTPTYPVLYPSSGRSWDSVSVANPTVLLENGIYHMFYSGHDGSIWSLGHAFSFNGINWVKSKMNPILGRDPHTSRSGMGASGAHIHRSGSLYMIWLYIAHEEDHMIGYTEAQFLSIGTLISDVIDSYSLGSVVGPTWGDVTVHSKVSTGTATAIALRSMSSPVAWGDWTKDYFATPVTPEVWRWRYLQHRLTLFSFTGDDTPVVEEVSGEFEGNKAPSATLLSPVDGACTSEARLTFSWNFSDPEGDEQYWYRIQVATDPAFGPSDMLIDATASNPLGNYRPYDPFTSDGTYYWRVTVADTWFSQSPWSDVFEMSIDREAPQTRITIDPPPANGFISTTTLLSLDATDETCGVSSTYYSIDGNPFVQYTTPFSIAGQGSHSIRFFSVDLAGNFESSQSRTFQVDGTPPDTEAVLPDQNVTIGNVAYLTSSAPIVLLSSDDASGLQLTQHKFDAAADWTNNSLVDLRGLSGPHTLHFRAIDNVWNFEPSKSQQLFIDDTAPVTTLAVEGPQTQDSPIHVTPATNFNLTPTEAGVGLKGVYYQIDGLLPAIKYNSSLSIGAEGSHTLSYYSVDLLNNIETKRSLKVIVDGSGPATSLIPLGPAYTGPTEMFVMSSTSLSLSSMDGWSSLAAIRFSFDGGIWTNYTIPFRIATEGPHTLSFYGVDVLGNTETVKSLDIVVDDSPPCTQVSLSGVVVEHGGQTYINDMTQVVLDSIDNGSGVLYTRYKVDGGGWVVYTEPFKLHGPGTHIVEVQATDNLGLSEPSGSMRVVLDESPPVARAGQDIATFAPTTITLEGLASTDDTTIVSYTWVAASNGTVISDRSSVAVSLEDPGTYTFTLTVRDPLGRESTDNVTVRLLLDPDSDRDLLPDIWERQRFGNLTYGPNDDPDGDGATNMQEYQHEGGTALDGGAGGVIQPEDSEAYETLILLLLTLVGVLAGVVVLTVARNRELRRRLDERRAEESVDVEGEF